MDVSDSDHGIQYGGQNSIFSGGQIAFVTLDILALEYNVIPHFRLIWVHWLRWNIIFTFQGHPEVKTEMTANIQHENHHFLVSDYF